MLATSRLSPGRIRWPKRRRPGSAGLGAARLKTSCRDCRQLVDFSRVGFSPAPNPTVFCGFHWQPLKETYCKKHAALTRAVLPLRLLARHRRGQWGRCAPLAHAWIILQRALARGPPLGLGHVRGRYPKVHTGLQRFTTAARSARGRLAR